MHRVYICFVHILEHNLWVWPIAHTVKFEGVGKMHKAYEVGHSLKPVTQK